MLKPGDLFVVGANSEDDTEEEIEDYARMFGFDMLIDCYEATKMYPRTLEKEVMWRVLNSAGSEVVELSETYLATCCFKVQEL